MEHIKNLIKKIDFSGFALLLTTLLLITSCIKLTLYQLLTPVLISIPILLLTILYLYSKGELAIIKASISWVLLGLSLLALSIFGEDHFAQKSVAVFWSAFSAVFVSLGIINIVLQLKDTKDYFAQALSDLVTKDSYISKLSRQQLEILQKRVLERFFETSTEFDRENSFYKFFNKDLQKHIGSPYRENYFNSISVEEIQDTNYKISDYVSYTARAVGGEIQNEIRWAGAKHEINKIISFKLLINKEIVFTWDDRTKTPESSETHKHNFNSNVESNGVNFTYSLKNYRNHEKLHIEFETDYITSTYRSVTLKVIYPTFGFTVTLTHPKELKSRIEMYGLDTNNNVDYNEKSNPNGVIVYYKNWLLPFSGLYIDIQPVVCELCTKAISSINITDEIKTEKTDQRHGLI